MVDIVGWVSSLVLLTTIVTQIAKQWNERSDKGVSPWLFIGQTAASFGFTLYSVLVKNWVFTVTNGLMLVSAIVGWQITRHFRRSGRGTEHAKTSRHEGSHVPRPGHHEGGRKTGAASRAS